MMDKNRDGIVMGKKNLISNPKSAKKGLSHEIGGIDVGAGETKPSPVNSNPLAPLPLCVITDVQMKTSNSALPSPVNRLQPPTPTHPVRTTQIYLIYLF